MVSEMRPPLENPIRLGSLYNIAKLMGVKFSGRASQDIKKAIQRIIMTGIESKGTFYQKGQAKWATDIFHLYERVVFLGETLPDGATADTNHLFFSSWYLDNINARYVKPLRLCVFPLPARPRRLQALRALGSEVLRHGLSPIHPLSLFHPLSAPSCHEAPSFFTSQAKARSSAPGTYSHSILQGR